MRLVREISALFTGGEKLKIAMTALTRISLVGLDLIGIVLIGAVASLIAGTTISSQSQFGKVLAWFDSQGIRNSYAVIFGAALVFFILKGILSVVLISYTSGFMARLETKISERVFTTLLSRGFDSLGNKTREELIFSATHSVTAATTKAILVGSTLASEASLLVIISLFLAFTNLALFLEITVFFGLIAWLMHRFVTVASGRRAKSMHASLMISQGVLMGALENRKQIYLSRNQASLVTLFAKSRANFSEESAKYQTLTTLPRYITEIAVILGGAILVLQRSLSNDGSITAPTIAIFVAAIFRIVASMVPIQGALGTWKAIEFESQDALETLREPSALVSAQSDNADRSNTFDVINFKEVSFSYPNSKRETLKDLNLTIAPGEFIGIIGNSGSGKSTFADLLLGLIKPTGGEISIDGETGWEFLKKNLGFASYVPQATYIFPGSLRQNVSLNFLNVEPNEESRVKEALTLAGLANLLLGPPDALEAKLGENGRTLSGGETQRIGLARALYDEPSLLVLDEVTSALDDSSQQHILESIETLKGKVTLVVIAHKIEALRAADRVFQVEKGELKLSLIHKQSNTSRKD